MKMHKHMSRSRVGIALLKLLVFCSFLSLMQTSSYALSIQSDPQDISIGIGYNGSHLLISGQHAPGEQVIIRISSPSEDTRLKYKGKAGGFLWMKMGDMTFKSVPALYIIRSPESLDKLLSKPELTKYNLGYAALSAKMTVESAKPNLDKSLWQAEFIKFKENEHLYKIDVTPVDTLSSSDTSRFQYQLDWPYQAAPGTYRLEAFAVKDQHVVDQAFKEITVRRSGIVAYLSSLAFNRAAIYGLVAVLIAALAGLAVGLIFKGGGAH